MNQINDKYLRASFLLCCFFWLVLSFFNSSIEGIFSDEFIYFHVTHLKAKASDFFFYDPKLFFGHSPLVSFVHWLLSPFGMSGIRLFHVFGFWLILFSIKPQSLWQYLCCSIILFHPTFSAHASLLYPEIFQGLFAILIWQMYKRDQDKWCSLLFFVAIMWRESSLAFFFGFIPLILQERSLRRLRIFIPGLLFLFFHLGYVSFSESWNPGRVKAALSLPSYEDAFLNLNNISSFILGVGLFYPIILWPLMKKLKVRVNLNIEIQRKIELFFLLFLLVFFTVLTLYNPVTDSWFFFHRPRSLGYLGIFIIIGVSYFSVPAKIEKVFTFSFVSGAAFYFFFLFYRDISARDLVAPGLLIIYALSKIRPTLTLFVVAVLSFNLLIGLNYTSSDNKDFLLGSAAGLNQRQRDYYLLHFDETLRASKDQQLKLQDGVEVVVTHKFFVKTPLRQSVENSSKILSFDHQLDLPKIEGNVAFSLYLPTKPKGN
jgi:hypothetical protein